MFFITCLSLAIWLFLLLFWGKFWLSNCYLDESISKLERYPHVCAIVPARNEADSLPHSLPSILEQDYRGKVSIIVIDDRSSDGTAETVQQIAQQQKITEIYLISGEPLASNWKGKLWAMQQGIEFAREKLQPIDYFLFTDADIQHDRANISQLVNKAEVENLDLVSLMVLLQCKTFWEKLLIPAFVFFFQKLYPFPWVNDDRKPIAAAAGGCILIREKALNNIGGLEAISQALIDDCSLARAIKFKQKDNQKGRIWLGLTETIISLRSYDNLKTIWDTIARTAFTQLNYSTLLLAITLLGMIVVYLVPPISLAVGLIINNWLMASLGAITWSLMTIAYLPTIKLYKLSFIWGTVLPAIALLYTLMTIDSAVKHWQGKGGAWKGRTY